MRLTASAFAYSLLAASVFAADAPAEPPVRPPETAPKSEDTPEAAVRRMLHAISVEDRQELADSILPIPKAEHSSASLDPMTPETKKAAGTALSKPMRLLKAGDTIESITLENGKALKPGPDYIGPDKAIVQLEGTTAFFFVNRTEKGWRVDYATSVVCGLASIWPEEDWSFDEVARVTSPSGKLDAVLVEKNGGATTSFSYEVYVLPKGEKAVKGNDVASMYGACRNKSTYGANLRWEKDGLIVEYLTARGEDLKPKTVTVAGEKVRVELRPGVEDPTATDYNRDKPKQP